MQTENPMTAGFKIKAVANPKRDIKNRMENDEMKIETLKDRIEKAETKISKKQATIQKKLNWIDKKKQALEKYPDKESFEYRMMLCDVENYADDIKRIEKEITETESTLEKYRKQLAGELEKEDVFIHDIPDVLKDLNEQLIQKWDEWDKKRRDDMQADYMSLSYREFLSIYRHADMTFRYRTDEQIHDSNVQNAKNIIVDMIYRVRNITGEITDWDGLHATLGSNGYMVLNGTITGKEGTANVESITAGGYNIQRLHIRVLVHSI